MKATAPTAASLETKPHSSPIEWVILGSLCTIIVGAGLAYLVTGDLRTMAKAGLIAFMLPYLLMAVGLIMRIGVWTIGAFERTSGRDIWPDGQIGEPEIRLIPVRSQPKMYTPSGGGYTPDDLAWLLRYVYENESWSGRALVGVKLPSGRVLSDYDNDVRPFTDLLVTFGLLIGRSERARGDLVGDLNAARTLFGL
jgi:hypothetical protein